MLFRSCELCAFELSVVAAFEALQGNVHHSCAFERINGHIHRGAHAAYLVFFAFGKNYGESFASKDFNGAWLGAIALDIYAFLHAVAKIPSKRFFCSDRVFFLVLVLGIQ